MELELITVGSALMDVTIHVDEDFLKQENLPKGGMTLVDASRSRLIVEKLSGKPMTLCPGGAAANVAAAYAACGGRSGFIGKIGADEHGQIFREKTSQGGVAYVPLITEEQDTGVVLCLVTPDGQRTFATCLGASTLMTAQEMTPELLGKAPCLFLEGYLAFNPDLLLKILKTARENGQKIALDLASFTVVEASRDLFNDSLPRYVDILFANEEESQSYTGKGPRESLAVLASMVPLVIVKEGGRGSLIQSPKGQWDIGTEPVMVEDTNGAGDAYAGGFLFGMSRELSEPKAGAIASRAGALAVSQSGARLTEQNQRNLREVLSQIIS